MPFDLISAAVLILPSFSARRMTLHDTDENDAADSNNAMLKAYLFAFAWLIKKNILDHKCYCTYLISIIGWNDIGMTRRGTGKKDIATQPLEWTLSDRSSICANGQVWELRAEGVIL